MLYSGELKDYFRYIFSSFSPVMAPYQSGTDDDEGYEEDDDKQDGEEKTTESDLRKRTLPRRSLRTTTTM